LYAVLVTWRKLRHYFESHPITIVSSFPLGEVIQNCVVIGRITKWAVELMGEGITCNNPEISRKPKTTTTKKFLIKP
jgi:hypothetical protein